MILQPMDIPYFSVLKKTTFYINDEKIQEFNQSFTPDFWGVGAFNDNGQPFTAYVDNVRVLRSGQTSTEPQATTVVSTPDGKPVVVKVGDVYKWNSSLDGVMLWVVGNEDGAWSLDGTTKFENGNQIIALEIIDSFTGLETYDMPYAIDENGYLKVTETTAIQYYNVVSVENGVIGTIQDDGGVESVADNGENVVDLWFFTTRAAAEELNISHSAVSHHVRTLEERLNVRLFLRTTRRVKLTEEGAKYFPVIKDAFDRVKRGTAELLDSIYLSDPIQPPTLVGDSPI